MNQKTPIDKNKGLLLFHNSDGWILAKLTKFDMLTNDNNFKGYEIDYSLFNMTRIPEEKMNELFSYFTDDSFENITEIDLFS